jgi:hypothetical protein
VFTIYLEIYLGGGREEEGEGKGWREMTQYVHM